jgi:hypothetical protein
MSFFLFRENPKGGFLKMGIGGERIEMTAILAPSQRDHNYLLGARRQ